MQRVLSRGLPSGVEMCLFIHSAASSRTERSWISAQTRTQRPQRMHLWSLRERAEVMSSWFFSFSRRLARDWGDTWKSQGSSTMSCDKCNERAPPPSQQRWRCTCGRGPGAHKSRWRGMRRSPDEWGSLNESWRGASGLKRSVHVGRKKYKPASLTRLELVTISEPSIRALVQALRRVPLTSTWQTRQEPSTERLGW